MPVTRDNIARAAAAAAGKALKCGYTQISDALAEVNCSEPD